MLAVSYAKINLFLEVTGRLPNNYHQVNTVFCSIDLCDYLDYSLSDEAAITLSSSDPALENSNNLIYRVAHFLQTRYAVKRGINIHLDKHIPVAAGLGGGSSNAANCLLNLNKLWELNLQRAELHSIAAQFGSDINFFLEGGFAFGENRGEILTPMADIPLPSILLVNPKILISSSEAYKLVAIPDIARSFNPLDLRGSCFNRLEAGIRKMYPAIDAIINTISSFGADSSIMSGSGSTCFGLFNNPNQLCECENHFKKMNYWTKVVSAIPRQI
ncbi:MAG: 4-(cytidine 5'-diphospho)-2-C-methyl-D-erythritol kinase [Candidatus Cloacimonetes bacterium]|nr:4-(cytidine 5'-diphospho)-2-C-methyl-D-erythritol kinase [Candidatus Cloacimonadota bacterium]